MNLKLIPDWRLAWRFLSVQAAAALAVLSGIQGEVLPLVQPLFPADKWPWVSGALAMLIVVLRVMAQDGLAIEREQLELDRLDRHQLQVDELDASHIQEDWEQAMPAGRLERYLGAVLLLVALVCVLSIAAVAWLAVRGPSA